MFAGIAGPYATPRRDGAAAEMTCRQRSLPVSGWSATTRRRKGRYIKPFTTIRRCLVNSARLTSCWLYTQISFKLETFFVLICASGDVPGPGVVVAIHRPIGARRWSGLLGPAGLTGQHDERATAQETNGPSAPHERSMPELNQIRD